MRTIHRFLPLAFSGAMLLTGCAAPATTTTAAGPVKNPLDPKNPTTITVWNYYNGDQLAAFDALVADFNNTVGVEQGITVISESQSSVENVADSILNSADGKVGAQDLPDLAAVYAETAFILNQNDLLLDLDNYISEEELAAYIPGFVAEGRLTEGGPLSIFPVMKSTECLAINKTDWEPFEAASGISIASIQTVEDLTAAAKAYYEWTDSLTPEENDGKSLYGRDSVANYIYVGTKMLGHEMFKVGSDGKVTVDIDHDTFRKLWDNYYIPFVNGYFGEESKYRSDDMKTGFVIAVTSSTSGVTYLPTVVTDQNDQSHDIEVEIVNPLCFANGDSVAVQQGAGYVVVKSDEAREYASVEFLKWLTESDRNLDFAVSSGYSPVTVAANDAEAIKAAFPNADTVKGQNMLNALLVSSDVYVNGETYTCKPFEGSKDLRYILGDALELTAVNDRAIVKEQLNAGATLEDAVAPFVSDEYFEEWFSALQKTISAIVE